MPPLMQFTRRPVLCVAVGSFGASLLALPSQGVEFDADFARFAGVTIGLSLGAGTSAARLGLPTGRLSRGGKSRCPSLDPRNPRAVLASRVAARRDSHRRAEVDLAHFG
jgi:hypothetical protein